MRLLLVLVVGLLAPLAQSAPNSSGQYAKSSKKMKLTSRQICADLCTQGLGGPPCGDVCEYDLGHDFGASVPESRVSKKKIMGPRRSLCPYLCQFELGDPLCDCVPLRHHHDKDTVDWHGVCDTFCHSEGITVYGCPKCDQDPSKIPFVPSTPSDHHDTNRPDAQELINRGFKIVAAFDKNGKTLVSKEAESLLKDLSKTHNSQEMKMGLNQEMAWKVAVPKENAIHMSETIDWDRWCAIKCNEGEGGAACNCDALP